MVRVGLVAAGIVIVVAITAPAVSAGWKTFGKEKARGDYAAAVAGGNVNAPKKMRVKVKARPKQRITGNYDVVCSRGLGAGTRSGRFGGQSTKKETLKQPYDQPDSCSVGAAAQLSGKGNKIVVLLQVWR